MPRAYHFFLFRLVNFESYQKINNENQIFLISRNTFIYQGGSTLRYKEKELRTIRKYVKPNSF